MPESRTGSASVPWFAFEREVRPVPDHPTHCACGAELEPMRRYAGMCRACVQLRAAGQPPPPAPTARLESRMRLVREFTRAPRTGRRERERYVELQCSCGRKRVMPLHDWHNRQPLCCNRCRLRAVDAQGFEAEHVR